MYFVWTVKLFILNGLYLKSQKRHSTKKYVFICDMHKNFLYYNIKLYQFTVRLFKKNYKRYNNLPY